jgi:nucleoside-diphosphate-sugar epimerase
MSIIGDVADRAMLAPLVRGKSFDVVVDFLCYEPTAAAASVAACDGMIGQYIFLSSASVYQKPPRSHTISEATPLGNQFWGYARDKIACEGVFLDAHRKSGFPSTIVRPSHTYGRTWIPTAFVSGDFTVAARMLAGKPFVVPGDGQALWTITHARDFAVGLTGLLGKPASIGEAFTITGDEVLTWDEIHQTVASALGVEPRIVHVPSEFIAAVDPAMGERLLGDKAYTSIFDCSKVKRIVPELRTTIPFAQGIRESVAWRLADPARMIVDGVMDGRIDRILAAWERAIATVGAP